MDNKTRHRNGFYRKKSGINHYFCFDKTIDFEYYTEKMSNIPEYRFEGFGEEVSQSFAEQSQNYATVNA